MHLQLALWLLRHPWLGLLLAPLALWAGWAAAGELAILRRLPDTPEAVSVAAAAARLPRERRLYVRLGELVLDCERLYRRPEGGLWAAARDPKQPLIVVTLPGDARCATLVGEPFTGVLAELPAPLARRLAASGLKALQGKQRPAGPPALLLCTECARSEGLAGAIALVALGLLVLAVPLALRLAAPRLVPRLARRLEAARSRPWLEEDGDDDGEDAGNET